MLGRAEHSCLWRDRRNWICMATFKRENHTNMQGYFSGGWRVPRHVPHMPCSLSLEINMYVCPGQIAEHAGPQFWRFTAGLGIFPRRISCKKSAPMRFACCDIDGRNPEELHCIMIPGKMGKSSVSVMISIMRHLDEWEDVTAEEHWGFLKKPTSTCQTFLYRMWSLRWDLTDKNLLQEIIEWG